MALITVMLLGVVVLLVLLKIVTRNYLLARRIKGPFMPFIYGNLNIMLQSNAEFFPYIRECAKKYKTVFRFWSFGVLHVQAIRAREAEILMNSTAHAKKPYIYKILHGFLGLGLLNSNGERWKERRRMLTPTFHFNILKKFSSIFIEESVKVIKKVNANIQWGDPIQDVCVLSCAFTLPTICESAMGVKMDGMREADEYRDNLLVLVQTFARRLTHSYLHPDILFKLLGFERREKKLLKPIHNFTRTVIEKRRQMFYHNQGSIEDLQNENIYETPKRRYAMLDTLLSNEINGYIDAAGVQEEVDTFMFEGHDTTAAGLTFILLLLGHNPEAQERVYQEIREAVINNHCKPLTITQFGELNYFDRVIKECLRIYPPVAFISRELTEDVLLDDNTKVPAGNMMHFHIFDLHRDPEQFPDPEKFDPDRFLPENCENRHPFAFIPFSAGPRNCIGQKFAMLEIKTLLQYVLLNFKLTSVTKREDVQFTIDLVLRPLHPILVKFEKRNDEGGPLLSI